MKKLSLNKETVANLSSREMNEVKGLTGQTCQGETCGTSCGGTCVSDCIDTCVICVVSEGCTITK